MPLMSCPDCQERVSTSARACPHCGWPVPRPFIRSRWISTARVLLLLMAVYLIFLGVYADPVFVWGAALLVSVLGVSFRWSKAAAAAAN